MHALELGMAIGEIPTPYKERPPGSASKLRTYADGCQILKAIVVLVKEERPLQFFSLMAMAALLLALAIGLPVIATYPETGLVPRFPSAILASALVLVACLSEACGLILDSVARGRGSAPPRLSRAALARTKATGSLSCAPPGSAFQPLRGQDRTPARPRRPSTFAAGSPRAAISRMARPKVAAQIF